MTRTAHTAAYPRAALVTGAARRIGRAVASDLAQAGWKVAIHHNASADEAHALAGDIAAAGGEAIALQADLRDETALASLVANAAEALGPLGLLVNNASVFDYDDVESATRASWDGHMTPNLRAPFVLTQYFARQLTGDACGVVVNILDQRVWNPAPRFTSYGLSKAGLWWLTRALALELAPRIRVNAVGPGPALPSPRQSESDFQRQCNGTPLKIGTDPEEICRAVQFILAVRSLTGQMIALDGGQHLGWAVPDADDVPVE